MARRLKSINWNVFFILLASGLLGVVAILPYMFDLLGGLALDRAAVADIPLPLVVALALLQNGILLGAAIAIGLVLSARVGFRMPLIESWANGNRARNLKAVVVPGVQVGAATGAALVVIEAVFFLRHLPASLQRLFEMALWKRLLAGLVYGGVTEELFMRLFLLSLVAWLVGRWWKTDERMPAPGAFWAAILVVAVLFGLGHLPNTAMMTPLTPALIVRALVLNGLAGVAFGYLYWRHGLEAAMIGHMSAHVVMQIPGTMLLKALL